MKFKKATATGLLLIGLGNASLAGPPPLERPTPPPCCADGRCYANPLTYGWYETRWRHWPVESLEPAAAGQTLPMQPQADIPSFQAPPAEEEDRKAPPPSEPKEEPIKAPTTNPTPGPGGPVGPSAPEVKSPLATPPALPLPPQGPASDQTGPRRTLPPYQPQAPGARPSLNNSLKNSGPTGQSDPPPAPPFGPSPTSAPPLVRNAREMPAIPVRLPAPTASVVPTDDPPPGLPVTLATWSN